MRKVDDGIEVNDITVQMQERGSHAQRLAVRSIVDSEIFYELPTKLAEDLVVIGYMRNVSKHKLSKRIGVEMLKEDLQHVDAILRPKIFMLEEMTDKRYESLLYLGMAVGVDVVLRSADLWKALKASDYVAAQQSVLRLYWTQRFVGAEDKRAQTRIMKLAEAMRCGE